jgi:hypothetical protein
MPPSIYRKGPVHVRLADGGHASVLSTPVAIQWTILPSPSGSSTRQGVRRYLWANKCKKRFWWKYPNQLDRDVGAEWDALGKLSWLSVKWRSDVLRKCRLRPCGAGIFQGMRVYHPMAFSSQCTSARGLAPALLNIGSMSPPGYPSALLPPGRARLRFTRRVNCSSAAPCCSPLPACALALTSSARDANWHRIKLLSTALIATQIQIVTVPCDWRNACGRLGALRRGGESGRKKRGNPVVPHEAKSQDTHTYVVMLSSTMPRKS